MTSGGGKGQRFSGEIRPGAGFTTGDFVEKKSWGGYRKTTLDTAYPTITND